MWFYSSAILSLFFPEEGLLYHNILNIALSKSPCLQILCNEITDPSKDSTSFVRTVTMECSESILITGPQLEINAQPPAPI